jgi:SWI/SNF-related matrix-associated actin-dependent regulator 1 of chromatin subfamily A
VAAKEGITLTAADTVLFIEREWVPSHEEQAEDRVYRIGQDSDNVHAIYLSCIGTIDEHFDRIVEQKRSVVKAVLDGSSTETGRQTLLNDLLERLREERI